MSKAKVVLSLIAGLFVANGAFAAMPDSYTELDPRVRAEEQKEQGARKAERPAPAVESRGRYDFLERFNP